MSDNRASREGVPAPKDISQDELRQYLDGERRAHLTAVDNIDRITGGKRRTVRCPHCGGVFEAKKADPNIGG